jgi:hypothetical protein
MIPAHVRCSPSIAIPTATLAIGAFAFVAILI